MIYTRTTDATQSVGQKAAIANEEGADLFISIHRNASDYPGQYNGVQTLIYDDSGFKKEMAENINANVREIEGALSSLVANASFLGKKISITLAREILKVYVQFNQREITIEHIRKVVCEYMGLSAEVFNSPKRTREIAQARQIAMYLSKQHTKAPLTTIGAAIGGKNHATVLHACKAISNLMETDKVFCHQVEEIEKKVLARS